MILYMSWKIRPITIQESRCIFDGIISNDISYQTLQYCWIPAKDLTKSVRERRGGDLFESRENGAEMVV